MTAHPLFDIGGRTALVTGSSRGIGLALARGLAEAGCRVVLNGRDGERLTEAAAGLPGDVHTAAFDVTDGPSVAAGIAEAEERVGPLDILVNNAGIQLRAPLLEFADADWHRILDTNLTSAFLVG
ncbi:SDR family NAD(P)-dependent oxidoreductase, partial [Streptomyces sp. NPDC005047]